MNPIIRGQPAQPPSPLSDFREGQWWIEELDKAAAAPDAPDDFRRAVAVVHHMLRAAVYRLTSLKEQS
jgi:hypothetical protein